MKKTIAIRTGKDRLRYALVFELLLISILSPVGAYVFERQIFDVGLLAVVLSLKAVLFNLIYNWFFDLMDVRKGRIPTKRSVAGRIIHAIGFEIVLVTTSLPIVMWWLDFTVLQALVMDAAVTSFIVLYTFLFGLSYDRLSPVPQPLAPDSA